MGLLGTLGFGGAFAIAGVAVALGGHLAHHLRCGWELFCLLAGSSHHRSFWWGSSTQLFFVAGADGRERPQGHG